MMNWKGFGRKRLCPILANVWSVLVEQQKTSTRISDSPTEIRTKHLVRVWSVTAIPATSDTEAENMLMLSKVLHSEWCTVFA
jgi:uncharacterized membrane protein